MLLKKNKNTCNSFAFCKHRGLAQSHEFEQHDLESVTTFHERQLLCLYNNSDDVQFERRSGYLGDGTVIDRAARAV